MLNELNEPNSLPTSLFIILDDVLYYVDPKWDHRYLRE